MKKILGVIVIIIGLLILQNCGLLSAAGFSSQGLSAKKVSKDLALDDTISSVTINHDEWTVLLKKHVNENGFVNYKNFINDRDALKSYLQKLATYQPNNSWSVHEQLAYYINVYNAQTVNLILENYPTKSIKNISGQWTRAFVAIGDKNFSLGGIENSLLRKMNEPRIHFAINCASYSCPMLLNEAFTASNIDAQLDIVTRNFINSNKNDITANTPRVSQLFNWYKKDFLANGTTSVIEYINKYSDVKINVNASLQFKDYNWKLNEQ